MYGDKKHYCGNYKGYRIYQVGQMIGSNFYGEFYASQLRGSRYMKVKDSEHKTWEELKAFLNNLIDKK